MTKQPGIKQDQLEPCALCGKGVMHAGSPQFYRVTIETFIVNLPAVQRAAGLEQMMGGHAGIAFAMGPQEDMAKRLHEPRPIIVCLDCMIAPRSGGGVLVEAAAEKTSDKGDG